MAERFSCALASVAAEEPCYGTASQVTRWILVEQPGSWGANAVTQSGLPIDVATRLRAVARSLRARLLVVRRHGRSNPGRRNCFVAVTTAARRHVERLTFDDPAELLAVNWTPLRDYESVGGAAVDQPLYLVCTNGSHDTCCARFGRPVAAVLDAELGDQVWEASHFGGDRFAGNLVCLPDGIYYGRVSPDSAMGLVELHRRRQLSLANLRGRSFSTFVAQAAEHFVRVERDLTGVDDIAPGRVEELGGGLFKVSLRTAAGDSVAATVACTESPRAQQLTCRAGAEEHPPRYRLVSLD